MGALQQDVKWTSLEYRRPACAPYKNDSYGRHGIQVTFAAMEYSGSKRERLFQAVNIALFAFLIFMRDNPCGQHLPWTNKQARENLRLLKKLQKTISALTLFEIGLLRG